MTIKDKWKYHVLLWLIVIVLGYITDVGYGGIEALKYNISLKGFTLDFTFYITSILIYLINYTYVCPRFLSKNKSVFLILAFIGLVALFAGVRYVIDEVFIKAVTGNSNYYGTSLNLQYYFFDNLSYAIKTILYSTVIFLIFRFIEAQNQILQLQLNHKKAELSFLKTQLSPHFLFNTLNTFYSELLLTQPETAKDIHKLSTLLRYVTYESDHEFIELKKEINFIKDYIYFYKKRFENELFVSFNVIGSIREQKVASLVLMHFIENVFKHGILNDKECEAQIEIKIKTSAIYITTKNKFDTSLKYMNNGIGIENLKRRLETVYGDTYLLEYSSHDSYFKSYLKLPVCLKF